MDGTLLPQTTGLLAVASALDTVTDVDELERQFAAGTINTVEFTRSLHRLWGIVPQHVVREVFDACAKLDEIREVTTDIATNGGVSCLITMSQNFFADHFRDFGFDHVFASMYPKTADAVVRDADILTPESKPAIARELCSQHGFAFEDTVAFGDSGSDIPLFRALRYTLAVNGTEQIRRMSAASYQGNSLLAAYELALDMISADDGGTLAQKATSA